MTTKIFYTKNGSDALNGLHIVNPNFGWVEYLQQHNQKIFYAKEISEQLFQDWKTSSCRQINSNFLKKTPEFFGLLKQLVQFRMNGRNFSMPLFATGNNLKLTCGSTRLIAYAICNSSPDQIPVVFQLNPGEFLPDNIKVEQVQSTDHFNELADLVDTDYTIDFFTGGEPVVGKSMLHQIDYQPEGINNLINIGNSMFEFWQRFTHKNRINITVSCNDPSQIKYDPNIWNVEILKLPEHVFGYGGIMKKFDEASDGKLHVWVNRNHRLTLEYLLPWPNNHGVCWWHTQDKNLHMFETTAGPLSVHRTISIIGNIVK